MKSDCGMIQTCQTPSTDCAAVGLATTNLSGSNVMTNNPPSVESTAPAAADTYVHARIDTPTKLRATNTLHRMGLSVSDAIRMLMQHLATEHCLPPGMKAPGVAAANQLAPAVKGFQA